MMIVIQLRAKTINNLQKHTNYYYHLYYVICACLY